jgi:hypothetical protein
MVSVESSPNLILILEQQLLFASFHRHIGSDRSRCDKLFIWNR